MCICTALWLRFRFVLNTGLSPTFSLCDLGEGCNFNTTAIINLDYDKRKESKAELDVLFIQPLEVTFAMTIVIQVHYSMGWIYALCGQNE